MPTPAFPCSSNLGTSRFGKFCSRLQGTQEGQRTAPPLLPLYFKCPSPSSAAADSSVCFLFRSLLCPLCCLSGFFWLTNALSGRQPIPGVSSHRHRRITGPGGTDLPGFPLSFPTSHCQPHTTYLKETFLENWPQTETSSLRLNHSCLNKQYYFCLATLVGTVASQNQSLSRHIN